MARYAKCYKTGKVAFPNRLECDIDRARILQNGSNHRKQRDRELPHRSYQCEFCRCWHHTSQPKREENESQPTEW